MVPTEWVLRNRIRVSDALRKRGGSRRKCNDGWVDSPFVTGASAGIAVMQLLRMIQEGLEGRKK